MSKTNVLNTLLGLAIVGIFGWIIWYFISNIQAADANVKAGIFGLFSLLLTAILTHFYTKRREINARHYSEKREAYRKIIDLVYDIAMSTKLEKNILEGILTSKMIEFKKELMIWGGSEVIETWNKFEMVSQESNGDSNEIVVVMEKFLRAIRKDLGHNDHLLKFGNLIGLMITSEDKKIILDAKN